MTVSIIYCFFSTCITSFVVSFILTLFPSARASVVRTKREQDEEPATEPAVDDAGTPVAPLEEESPVTESDAEVDLSTLATTSEAPTSLATTVLDSVVETTTKEHSVTDAEGHWKSKLDFVEYLQGPVIVIAIIVVVSLILLFLYVYKFRSNIRRQSVVNQI